MFELKKESGAGH